MKPTLPNKLGSIAVIMISAVIVYSLCADLYIWYLHEQTRRVMNGCVPLVMAAEQMVERKTAGRNELKDYLLEDDPNRLSLLEDRIRALTAAHDEAETDIGQAIRNMRHEYPRAEMLRIWSEAVATIMPEFDREAAATMATHGRYLEVRARRLAGMVQHEEREMHLFHLLVEMQNTNQNLGPAASTLANLKTLHWEMKDTDEEYIAEGRTLTPEERLTLRSRFVDLSTEFAKLLKELEGSEAGVRNQTLVGEMSGVFAEFIFLAAGRDQLFDLYEQELEARHQRLVHMARADVLGQLDSKMARELSVLAREQLSNEQNRICHLVKRAFGTFMIVSAGIILACWAVMRVVSKKIVMPIMALSEAARALARGDLTRKVDISASDEIGDLCAAFNEMADDLRTSTTSVENLNREIRERENLAKFPKENPNPVLRLSGEGAVMFANDASRPVLETLGIREGQDVPHGWRTRIEKAMASRKPCCFEFPCSSGRIFLMTLTPIAGEGYVNTYGLDITERRKAEDALEELNRHLESANLELARTNKELQEFAHIAAHDLKTPLRAIGTLADWISTDYAEKFDEQGKEQVRLLVTRAKQMTALIDDILQYSTAGQKIQKSQPVDLNALVAEVIAEIAPPEGIEVVTEKELPTIMGKKTHIAQIFQNLVGNAVQHMNKPRGYVGISCVEQRDFWQFSVADDGPGIEARYFEKIFKIFQTLGPREGVESTGIGLSIVKKLVELNNGCVWVESQVGKGSTFLFTLPKQQQGVASANSCLPATSKHTGEPAREALWFPFL